MGLFDRILNSEEEKLQHNWKVLTTLDQLDEIVEASFEKPVGILKHSIRCGISSMIKWQLESNWDLGQEDLDFYYLDLINHRPISNRIAEKFDVIHQSPQLLLINEGTAVYSPSHHMISVNGLKKALGQI